MLADINRNALAFSAVNATLNELPETKTVLSDVLMGLKEAADVIIANPPYLVDEDHRLYRHGGGELGIALAQPDCCRKHGKACAWWTPHSL